MFNDDIRFHTHMIDFHTCTPETLFSQHKLLKIAECFQNIERDRREMNPPIERNQRSVNNRSP